jgi:hypothetical protein
MKNIISSSSKVKATSIFTKNLRNMSNPVGWIIVLIKKEKGHYDPRYVYEVNYEAGKTFRFALGGWLHKNHQKPLFFTDAQFQQALGIVEGMMCNGYQAALSRVFEKDLEVFEERRERHDEEAELQEQYDKETGKKEQ